MRKRLGLGLMGSGIMSLLTAGAVGALVWMLSSHRLSLAGAGAAAGAIVLLTGQLQGLSQGAGLLLESSLFIEDFNSFVRSMPAMVAHGHGGRVVPPARFKSLKAEAVSFTYPSRQSPSLIGATIEIHEGEVVALVGENGSGKTTLAKTLAGLYRPGSGRVLWDGTDAAIFDPQYVLANGRVVENGTHCQLMSEGGVYSELFTLQATSFFDNPDDAGSPLAFEES